MTKKPALSPLLQPPPVSPKPRIGFRETAPVYGARRRTTLSP